jgi:hypothetical protein
MKNEYGMTKNLWKGKTRRKKTTGCHSNHHFSLEEIPDTVNPSTNVLFPQGWGTQDFHKLV